MAALSEEDRKVILGKDYVPKTAAQLLAENTPHPIIAFFRKIFGK